MSKVSFMDWVTIETLRKTAFHARAAVAPLLGKVEAGRKLGRGAGGDETALIDKVAEDAVLHALRESIDGCTVVSEESGVVAWGDRAKARERYILVDSVDGSNNAVRGVPFAAVSLAASNGPTSDDIFLGVVLDLYTGEAFTAEKHRGAHMDGVRITSSTGRSLDEAIVGVDLSKAEDEGDLRRLVPLLLKARHIRHLGANALELCYVAAGRTDALIDVRSKLRVTDTAAAVLIVREAGGIVVDEHLQPLNTPITSPTHRVSLMAAGDELLLKHIGETLGLRSNR